MFNADIFAPLYIFALLVFLILYSYQRRQNNKGEEEYALNEAQKVVLELQQINDENIQKKQDIENSFLSSVQDSKDEMEVLELLKARLLVLLEKRWDYERTHSSSKEELYRESSVMSFSIDALKSYEDETDLVNYCALILDSFDKDRAFNYGISLEKIYTLRYIYGSVQSIIEYEINAIQSYEEGLSDKIVAQRKQIEAKFYKEYESKRLEVLAEQEEKNAEFDMWMKEREKQDPKDLIGEGE